MRKWVQQRRRLLRNAVARRILHGKPLGQLWLLMAAADFREAVEEGRRLLLQKTED